MSYILDALKKSENHKRKNNLTILSDDDIHLDAPVDSDYFFKRWMILISLTFIFLLVLICLAWLLFYYKDSQQKAFMQASSKSSETQSVQNIDTANQVNTENNILPVVANTPSLILADKVKSNNSQFEQEQSQNSSSPSFNQDTNNIAADNTNIDNSSNSVNQGTNTDDFEIISTGLPEVLTSDLVINVLSFAPSKDKRFVMINGKSYKEGAVVDLGQGNKVRLIQIRQDGAVVQFNENYYLKRP